MIYLTLKSLLVFLEVFCDKNFWEDPL